VIELVELANWFGWQSPHAGTTVDSLPSPSFRVKSGEHVSFSSNNYLSIAASPRLKAAAIRGIETYGVGNCESRLLTGNLDIYNELERKLARSKGKSGAILFATGYLANLGTLSSLPRAGQYARLFGFSPSGDHTYGYFCDEYNHISIREGVRASGAARATYRHLDLDHLETLLRNSDVSTKIIVTDGIFSQDGDIAPLPDLLQLANRYDALVYVDDAHGSGVLGATGAGILEHFGIASERLIYMGTLSKAYGAIGGFIAANPLITEIIRVTCPSYGFTSTLPPDQALAVSTAIDIVRDEPERRRQLWENQRYFVERMSSLSYHLVSTATPIVPILIGGEKRADKLAEAIRAERLHLDVIKFPAVPFNAARLRVQLNAHHTRDQIDRLVGVLARHEHVLKRSARKPGANGAHEMAAVTVEQAFG
jgi:glycine C-acetyltransferase